MGCTIRSADIADVPAIHRIRLSVRENRLSDRSAITETSYLAYLEGGSLWVAETDSGIAGFAALDRVAGTVWALFVAPDAEGQGIGRALHDMLLEAARAQGLQKLSLSTAPDSRAALFYARAGWRNTGVTETGELRFEKRLASDSLG